jgi:sialate O-acetylesterase
MIFPMGKVENAKEEMAAADHPAIRFFNVKQQFAREPLFSVEGEWKPVTPGTVAQCSAVAYYFARDLQQKLGVPIGLLTSSVAGTRIETLMQPQTLSSLGLAGPLMEKWKNISTNELKTLEAAYKEFQNQRDNVHPAAVALAKQQGEPIPPEPRTPEMRPHDCPGALHHGMIAPLQPFAIRGALWYQGESNLGNHGAYEKMLPALIADWRAVWGDTMPILIVQLPPHKSITPEFREVQYRVWQRTPKTAMVVTTDVGDEEDIHPARKRPIGKRLAIAARAVSYGELIESSGPVFERMSVEGDRAVLSFAHIGDGLMVKGESLKGFVVAGSDKRFFPAQASIQGANVIVTSDQVKDPTIVHYGHERVPEVNLYNKDGLPAVPFRSDAPTHQLPHEN